MQNQSLILIAHNNFTHIEVNNILDNITNQIFESWLAGEGVYTNSEILAWVEDRNKTVAVKIEKTTLAKTQWLYDEESGCIVNKNRAFFQIAGLQTMRESKAIAQPIMLQNEIGFLGFLCRQIDGVLHFLVQAKIEPGNINKIQLSPTVQATKSNFTQKHGGKMPPYVEYFLKADSYTIIVDQIQSEQNSRFLKKRNRNVVLMIGENEKITEPATHRWMTLGQIKCLMKIDNLVNMDTRTVLSCIPMLEQHESLSRIEEKVKDLPLLRSITQPRSHSDVPKIFNYINDYKMFADEENKIVPLFSLTNWSMNKTNNHEEFFCETGFPFKIVFCDISIEGREVRSWGQPLFEAEGMAWFGLITTVCKGIRQFLVSAKPEVGCFDKIELAPTIQLEVSEPHNSDFVTTLFFDYYNKRRGIVHDVILSEEGGRFYHEQNHNVVLEINKDDLPALPNGYFWLTYRTLNELVQINNGLNIQLRNLLILMEL